MFFELVPGENRAPVRSERHLAAVYRKLFVIVSQSETQKALFDAVNSLLSMLFGASTSLIGVLHAWSLRIVASQGDMVHLSNAMYPIGKERMEQVIRSNTAQRLRRSEVSNEFLNFLRNAEFEEFIYSPLYIDGNTHGVLCVVARTKNYFSESDMECLADIASYLAMLLEHKNVKLSAIELSHYYMLGNVCERFKLSLQSPIIELLRLMGSYNVEGKEGKALQETNVQFMGEVLAEIESMAKPMQELASLSEAIFSTVDETEWVHPKELVHDLLSYLRRETEVIESVNVQVEESIEPLELCKNAIWQALNAVVTNAIYAIQKADDCDKHLLAIRVYTQPNVIVFEVTDTGCGIDASDLHRLYEPFFTTWPKRSGLGLSTAKLQVLRLGGSIEIKNLPDRGVQARILLPAYNARQQAHVF